MLSTDPKGKWAFYSSHLGAYMRRWILRTPWFTLRLHNILKSDDGRDFHDHPFDFMSFILWGGYVEHRPGCICFTAADHLRVGSCIPCGRYGIGSVVRRHAEELHRLELSRPAWTFVVTGKYFRNWGFETDEGWVPYQDYDRSYDTAPSNVVELRRRKS